MPKEKAILFWQYWIDAVISNGVAKEDAWQLAVKVSQVSYASLRANQDRLQISQQQIHLFSVLIHKYLSGVPLAYLLGEQFFMGYSFEVDERVLIPRVDTEVVVLQVLDCLRDHLQRRATTEQTPLVLLDMGTGSGVIAITTYLEWKKLSSFPLRVIGVDVSHSALQVAEKNASRLLGDEASQYFQWVCSDWFSSLDQAKMGLVDVVVSNPPYIPVQDIHLSLGGLHFEPQQALTDFGDGLYHLKQVIGGARSFLKPNAWAVVEHGFDQQIEVQQIYRYFGFVDVQTKWDQGGNPRCTFAKFIAE
jgi:release factor glutamine methyltransferase